jgi:hypothetical protein
MIKRKLLAVTLSLAMIVGMSTTVFAEEASEAETKATTHSATSKTHGTADTAEIGADGTFTQEDGANYNGKTQFYINVDKDGTGTKIEIPDPEDVKVDDPSGACHYELEWTRHREATIKATVPLYVCMYGYGGTGEVVTPEQDAYQIKNDSTYTEYKTISAAYAYYEVKQISGEENYTDPDGKTSYKDYISGIEENTENGEVTITGTGSLNAEQKSGQYGYYVKDNKRKVVKLSECAYDGEHRHYKDTDDSVLSSVYLDAKGNITTQDAGGTQANTDTKIYIAGTSEKAADLPLNVPTIKAESYTWKIMPTSKIKDLEAGQISMTIKDLDLSTVEGADKNTLDIKDLGWVVPAGATNTLSLPIKAAIAGGSVNEEGCVPVVRVTYTVVPAYDAVPSGASDNGAEGTSK